MNDNLLSRRDFLKLGGATMLGLLFPHFPGEMSPAASTPMQGRVQATSLVVRDAPAFSGKKVTSVKRDALLDLTELVYGGADGNHNRQWYRLGDQGYVYSGWIQSVSTTINPILAEIPETGVLGEITIPIAESYWAINSNPTPGPRLYFATNHWITAMVVDQRDGSSWYKAYDNLYNSHYYVRPEWMHLFLPEEISSLSPQVPENEKRIEIILDRQLLFAYEWNQLVYAARVATGQKNYETPTGWFHTFHKRPTYHMTGGADDASVFDLPGVPWDSYITENGVAIHGTYWHNDFGHPHSHGCINMSPQDAKWIYRWSQPTVPAGERLVLEPGTGTRVNIVQT
jgi:hypothetical protein